jgi:heat shock protein HslJ
MKKLWLFSTLALSMILLVGCSNNSVELENNNEWDVIEIQEEDIIPEDNELEEMKEEIIDGQGWNLMAFNWKEVDWNYRMIIKDNGEISIKFCNGIWWTISFDWEDEWTISASLIQTEMACEWESMDLENAFHIDGAGYSIMPDEDGWSTMLITTINWDKFYWRTILN